METKKVVTVDLGGREVSNTFFLELEYGDYCFLNHPLNSEVYIKVLKRELNIVPISPNRDSVERGLGYVRKYEKYLDYKSREEFKALCTVFIVHRNLTTNFKGILAKIIGKVTRARFTDDINKAIDIVNSNKFLLDEFNLIWYGILEKFFTGRKKTYNENQRRSIFNMAGFVLAELENPKITLTSKEEA